MFYSKQSRQQISLPVRTQDVHLLILIVNQNSVGIDAVILVFTL